MNKQLKIGINIAALLLIVGFVWYIATSSNKQEVTYAEPLAEVDNSFVSPYKKISAFRLPDAVNRFELYEGKLYITAGKWVHIYQTNGELTSSFAVKSDVRDITVAGDSIYVLYPTFIEVYNPKGELIHEWEACSDLSDYCSMAVAGEFLFVTDAENKNICKYTREGGFNAFISSPNGFIIPSYAFDIEYKNNMLYCSNSGRHLIESYTVEGKYVASFGGAGTEPGRFAGCCNPSFISFTPEGDLLTSEKGIPRISLFSADGSFKEVLLNSRLLGSGNKPCEVRAENDQLFVAAGNTISIYQTKTI